MRPEAPSYYYSVEGSIFYSTALITNATIEVTFTASFDAPVQRTETATGTYRFSSIHRGLYTIAVRALNNTDYNAYMEESFSVDGNKVKDVYLTKLIRSVSPTNNGTVGSLRPTLVWENLPEAVSYSIEVRNAVGETVEEASEIAGTSYTLAEDLVNQGTYYWTVRAYNLQGTKVGSGSASFIVWVI